MQPFVGMGEAGTEVVIFVGAATKTGSFVGNSVAKLSRFPIGRAYSL